MDEKNEMSELFGEMTEPTETEVVETEDTVETEPTEAAEEAGPTEPTKPTEDTEPTEAEDEAEAEDEKDDGEKNGTPEKREPVRFADFPKKDEGVGGAGFCNIFVRKMMNGEIPQDICDKVKSGEKTLQGCWNWVYSKMYDDYVKSNGRKSGGFGEDIAPLIVRYFAEIPEGTVIKQDPPKVDRPVKNSSDKKKKAAKEIVKSVAKKAAKDAKKESGQGDFFSIFGM